MKTKQKLGVILACLILITLFFVSMTNYSALPLSEGPEKSQAERDCKNLGFCWGNERCYSMGARITVEPEDKKQDLAWIDEAYLYCGEKRFVPQKITVETCENDFECQSNKCFDGICQQKNGIKITEIYSDKETVVRNLLLREKEIFYFSGLNKNYSIGFGRNESNFIFLINDETYILNNKIFNLDNYSQITVESILFENGLPRANITLIESINPLNSLDSEDFYSETNKFNPEESQENKSSTQITGNIVEESNNGKVEKNIVDKLINFLRKLFGF
jgi:hypothetical protein